jgi:serine/threonine protein kinase
MCCCFYFYFAWMFCFDKIEYRYQILDILGQGTFGQVVKCQNIKTKEFVAVKVIKNKPAYYNQSLVEVAILDMVCTPSSHLCKVFEN